MSKFRVYLTGLAVNTWMLTYCEVCLNCQTFLEVTNICKYVAVFFKSYTFQVRRRTTNNFWK